jgi:hypothetical protein
MLLMDLKLNKYLIAAALMVGTSQANAAAYTFTTLDGPYDGPYNAESPTSVMLTGINDSGQIVGNDRYHGAFEYSNGIYTGLSGAVNGINNHGTIVGNTGDGRGYIDNNGTLSYFDMPIGRASDSGYILYSTATGINDSGQVVGNIPWGTGLGMGPASGFIYENGSLTVLSNQGGFYGINNSDQIIGNAGWQGAAGAFEYNNGTYSSLPDIGGIQGHGGPYIRAQGINNSGLIVGYDFSGNGTPSHGFIYDGSTYTTINDPNATATNGATIINGINDLGQLVGYYNDSTGIHGFLATPVSAVPIPAAIWLFGSALIGLVGFNRRKSAHRII